MAEKELTVEQKLRTLYDLQLIDTRIDQILAIQGELPLEVKELEDEIEGLTTRLERFTQENKNFEEQVKTLKHTIVEARDLIARYEEQQKHVRNNREYDSISKEIEYQNLEIEHAEKLIRESGAKLEMQKTRIQETEGKLESLKSHLETKRGELETILEETRREHDTLAEKAEQIVAQIEPRLLLAYRKIRGRGRNGLAVVSIDRGASEGSYFTIPPQRQIEIAMRKKIIADENSGRILVDPELAREEREKMEEVFKNILE